MAGVARMATIRSASRASPSTASTAGPGSAFHGSCGFERGVGLPDEPPGRLEGLARRDPVPGGGRVGVHRRGHRRPAGCRGTGRAPPPPHLPRHHRGHPGEEVAEIVGEVGVVPGDHALVGEVAVGAERLVPQEVVAEAVDTECRHQIGRCDLVEGRLGHLLAADQQVAVDVDRLRRVRSPAAMSSAGQYTQWKRRMSLPIRWWTAGHQRSNRSRSSP